MVSLAGGPALIPSIVPSDQLSTANALEMLGWTIGGIGGPALAGLLISVIGATNVVLLDALTYAAFALALAAIVRITPPEVGHAAARGEGYSIWQAVKLMVASRVLLVTTLMFMAFNIGNGMLFVWLPLLTDQVLHGGPGLYGFLLAVLAVGEVIAVVLAGTLAAGVVIGLALFGVCSAPMTIWAQTLRMRIIPERMRGRTFALLRMIMQGGNPIGGALGGLLAGIVAIPTLVATSALLIMSPAVAGYTIRDLREAGAPDALPTPPPAGTEEDVRAGHSTG
jgi:MFS family permease